MAVLTVLHQYSVQRYDSTFVVTLVNYELDIHLAHGLVYGQNFNP